MDRSTSPSSEDNAQYDLMRALSALHLNGKYSDLTITHGPRRWACHKALVCSRSGFFDGACSHSFSENSASSSSSTIDLSEDPAAAVEQMITFFYQLDYLHAQPGQTASAMFRHRAYSDPRRRPPPKVVVDMAAIEDPLLAQAGFYARKPSPDAYEPSAPASPTGKKARWSGEFAAAAAPQHRPLTPPPESRLREAESSSDEADADSEAESHLILHTQVYALAEKYDIPALKALARRKFEMAMACYYDAPEFAAAIEEVYCSTVDTDRGLRDVVCQAFRSHPQLALTQDVYAVIRETPSLTLDLFKMERGIPL